MPHRHAHPENNEPTEPTAPAEETVEISENAEIAGLKIQLQAAIDERDGLKEQLLRTMADFQNMRRRKEQEAEQIRAFATEKLVSQLLPVLDNFERAFASFDSGASVESVIDGVRAVERQLKTALETQNVVRIPAVGHPFDPEVHEAIAMEATDEHEEGSITHELEAGYKIADRVIRPARVKVAKKK